MESYVQILLLFVKILLLLLYYCYYYYGYVRFYLIICLRKFELGLPKPKIIGQEIWAFAEHIDDNLRIIRAEVTGTHESCYHNTPMWIILSRNPGTLHAFLEGVSVSLSVLCSQNPEAEVPHRKLEVPQATDYLR